MPAISLVVCVRNERELLQRLLHHAAGLYDDLVVIHDGLEQEMESSIQNRIFENHQKPPTIDYSALSNHSPVSAPYRTMIGPADLNTIYRVVKENEGRAFVGPRCFQQEPHWPFAWSQAGHDWVLRLDADEFPSEQLKKWLRAFRSGDDPGPQISGYTCDWPIWDGKKEITRRWPAGRIFLFHRYRVSFFGVAEQVPVPDEDYKPLQLVLHHQPLRKSHGMRNVLIRGQARVWREVIARSLLGSPLDLPRWRWLSETWPNSWNCLRQRPLRSGFSGFVRGYLSALRDQWRIEGKILPWITLAGPLHRFLIGMTYRKMSAKGQTRGDVASIRRR